MSTDAGKSDENSDTMILDPWPSQFQRGNESYESCPASPRTVDRTVEDCNTCSVRQEQGEQQLRGPFFNDTNAFWTNAGNEKVDSLTWLTANPKYGTAVSFKTHSSGAKW